MGLNWSLEGGELPADYAPNFTVDSNQIQTGSFLQVEWVENGVTRVAILSAS